MNILIINHYVGNPTIGMEYRPYYLAKEFLKMGHNVSIIGASFSHLRNLQPKVKKDLTEEKIDGITYFWLKTPQYSGNIQRIINILIFVFKLNYYKKKIARMIFPDVVIASSTYPLDIYPSKKISKICKAKLCFEVHDLWPLTPMVIGKYSRFHPYIFILQKAENYAYKQSDIVVSLLGNAKEYMVNHGLDPNKFVHIPNGFDKEEFEKMQEEVPIEYIKLISDFKKEGKILIGYAGGHGPSNALHVLVDAAEKIKDKRNIVIISVGNGPSKNGLQLKAKNLENIIFLPPVPKRSIPKLLKMFDILYVGFVKSEIHWHGISPNKLIDYMLAAKPIILSADVSNNLVEECHCGIVVPAEEPIELCKALTLLISMSEKERSVIGENGKIFVMQNLNYQLLASIFINKILDLT